MWILLIRKLPTRPSPPKMSIFWAEPWPYKPEPMRGQTGKAIPDKLTRKAHDKFLESCGGINPNGSKALKIVFMGSDLRVWAEECKELSLENLKQYVGITYPGEGTHEFVPAATAEADVLEKALDADMRQLYDAALLDGCDHVTARLTAIGTDVTDMVELPPLGWYRPLPEVLDIYCRPHEATEDGPIDETQQIIEDDDEEE